VCFFVLCNQHWFNRVPRPDMDLGVSVCVSLFYVINTGSTGSRGPIRTWGLPVYPPPLLTLCQSTPNLIGCPSQHRGRPGSRSPGTKPQDRVVGPPSRTGPHLPVRHNRGSAAIPSSRSSWRIGLKPTRLHLDAHKYMEKKHRRVPVTSKSWGVEPHPLTNIYIYRYRYINI